MLIYRCEERITAKQALSHPYFKDMKQKPRRLAYSPQMVRTPESEGPQHNENKQHTQFPPIRPKYTKKAYNGYAKQNVSSKNINLEQKSPYSTKKISLEPRKPQMQRKGFHKSVF